MTTKRHLPHSLDNGLSEYLWTACGLIIPRSENPGKGAPACASCEARTGAEKEKKR